MAGKTIGELSESVSLDNTNLLAVSSDGNVLKKTTLSTLENSLTASNFNATSKATIAGLAMPSSRYIDLTLGASGATYTAPADGYVFVRGNPTANATYLAGYIDNIEVAVMWSNTTTTNYISFPVRKNVTYTIGFSTGSITRHRFYYAVGSEPEA